ncbi:MAG: hypothetical protein HOO86_03015 [Bacteroidales bacterium]|nr:hypothetical protein [Bacteroidales bacterium]
MSRIFTKDQRPETPYSLYSFFCLLVSLLFVQFLWVFFTSALLFLYQIPFTWHPLLMTDVATSWDYWTESRLYFVYFIVPLAMLLTGLVLLRKLNKNQSYSYKERILLNWLSFVLINMFASGIFAGVFIYDALGVVVNFMFPNLWFRLTLLLAPIIVYASTATLWAKLFLKTAPSSVWISNNRMKFRYILIVYILPLLFATVLMVLNSYWQRRWYLGMSFLSFLVLIVPMLGKNMTFINVLVHKSTAPAPQLKTVLVLIALLIALLISSPFVSLRFD